VGRWDPDGRAAVDCNPWGCATTTWNPHLSGHYHGTVAALAIHKCSGYWGPDRRIETYPEWQKLEAWLYVGVGELAAGVVYVAGDGAHCSGAGTANGSYNLRRGPG
jgi:hypothetical protein